MLKKIIIFLCKKKKGNSLILPIKNSQNKIGKIRFSPYFP